MRKLLLAAAMLLLAASPALAQAYTGAATYLATSLSATVVTVKAARGVAQFIHCYNGAAAESYIQFFDTTGGVTLGTTAPKFSVPLAASATAYVPLGVMMVSGIKIAATTGPTNGTAPGTALVCTIGFN